MIPARRDLQRDLQLPGAAVSEQVNEAIADLLDTRPPFTFPWPSLAQVVGGMPGGEVCYVGAFSGHGKTTFLSTLADELFERTHERVYYMGLESRPKTLRTHWACKRLGLDAGDILSKAYLQRHDAKLVRERLAAEIASQNQGAKLERVRFCPTPHVDHRSLRQAALDARDFGATVFVIDHVDHIDGRGNPYEQSLQVNRMILALAQEFGFLMLPATQFNNDAVRGSRSLLHTAPQPHVVKMGSHKREVATWMLGLYRPLKIAGLDPDKLKLYDKTGEGYADVIEPNCMAVSVMKHRLYGSREGQRVLLAVERGRVIEPNGRDFRDPRNP